MVIEQMVLIGKCLIIGVIWATLFMPVIFDHGGPIKYLISVFVLAGLCYIFRNYSSLINEMTIIALVAIVISWITSMAFFSKESKIKSKVIAFSSIIAGFSYLIVTLFVNINIF
jgi:uncharacterized protein YacL